MNLLELDIKNFAGAVGHQAAARLFAVLTDDENPIADNWYLGGFFDFDEDKSQAHLDFLSCFICDRKEANGAVIWALAKQEGFFETDIAVFAEEDFATKLAYQTFARVALATYSDLLTEQDNMGGIEAAKNQSQLLGLSKKDSIFEEETGMGDEVGHADAFRKADANAQAEQAKADKVEAEKVEAEKVEAEKVEADKIEAEQAEAEKLAADKAKAEKVEADKIEADEAAHDKAAADKAATDEVEADEAEDDQTAAEQAEADEAAYLASKAVADQVEAEKLAADKAKAEKVEADKTAAEDVGGQKPMSAGEPLTKPQAAKGGRPRTGKRQNK